MNTSKQVHTPSEKLTVVQLVSKYPAFHRILKCTTVFTRAPTGSYSQPHGPSSYPYYITLRLIGRFISHLYIDLPSKRFNSGFPTKNFICISHIFLRATCPANVNFLDLIRANNIWQKIANYEIRYTVSHLLLTYSLSQVKLFSPTSCPQTPSICVHPLSWDHVPHPTNHVPGPWRCAV